MFRQLRELQSERLWKHRGLLYVPNAEIGEDIDVYKRQVSYLPSTHYTTSAMMLAGERFTATAASTQNLLFQMASLIMPIVVGRVIDATGNYSLIWYIFLGCTAIAVLFSFFVKNDERP